MNLIKFTTSLIRNEEIQDRFINELQDKGSADHLQFIPDLKLDKILELVQNYVVRPQMEENQTKNIDEI